MPLASIPSGFARVTLDLFGSTGQAWLDHLPALVAECEHRWSIEVGPPFSLSYNFVAPAVRADGSRLVLKLGVPNPELTSEIAAMQVYAGRGAPLLLESEPERGILLMERVEPGVLLSRLDDERQAVSIAAALMRQLWQPVAVGGPFPTLARWTIGITKIRPRFDGGCGPFPERLVDRAIELRDELLASSTEPVLLHADLHHENILSARRQPWLAIDPKGVVGDPAYEPSTYLYNRLPEAKTPGELKALLASRIDQFAGELELDKARLLAWGQVQCILSAWWSYVDHGHGWEQVITVAGLLAEIG
jgi:streptomycin 6-kinase